MIKHRGAWAILLLALLASSVTFAKDLSPDLKAVVAGNNAFALNLYSILKKEKGNLFFSPYSISSALAMTYAGAKGKTAEEMAKVLNFALSADKTHSAFAKLNTVFEEIQKRGKVQLHIANSLWPQS